MKKILIVSTVSRQFYLFEQGNIEVLKQLGYEVHGAANFEDANERLNALDIIRHPFDIQRSPFNLKNIKAYFQLKKIMRAEQFDVVHCHSPMGGVIGRIAAKRNGIKKIIYTAHGFHFYKGAPLINWLLYYPIEKVLSKITDILITINSEDYEVASKLKSDEVYYIPGIGVDVMTYNKNKIINNNSKGDIFTIVSVGELNENKNHETVLEAISLLKDLNIKYLICGQGEKKDYLKAKVAELNINNKVEFLGYRDDILDIMGEANLFIISSFREGLSVATMEAMSQGLAVIASDIRGNRDLIDSKGGYLFNPNDHNMLASLIQNLYNVRTVSEEMGRWNKEKVKKFDSKVVKKSMEKIYC